MADRFNISLRTVYRDVKALDESGVPVIGEAGTGYSIMEGYRLPPVMFSQEEASALLLGAKLAEQFTDGSVKRHYNAALFKIKAVLRSTDKEHVDSLTDHVAVLSRKPPEMEFSPQCLSLLQQAIVGKRIVQLKYYSPLTEETTERKVEPFGLLYYGSAWHLIAWCRMRNGYRDFRVSRIINAILQDDIFDGSSHPSIQDYIDQIRSHESLHEVKLHFDKSIVKHMQDQKHLNGFVSEEDLGNVIRMIFLTSSLEYFARWVLMYTDRVKVESPEELRVIMRNLGERLSAHYK
jgi:predicted DNA-binding transcriptional regulator YafY